jgi:hypothetical protein
MDKAREFRDLAAQCVLLSCDASSEQHALALLDMAKRWRDLADQVERAEIAPRPERPSPILS